MFKYNKDTNILEIKQVEELELDIDLLQPHRESYRKFIDVTIYELVNRLCKVITDATGIQDLSADVNLIKRDTADFAEMMSATNAYYSVEVAFKCKGRKLHPIELTRIPYLDKYCVFNVDGKRKSIWCELANIEDISYDSKNRKVVVNFPNNSFSILLGSAKTGLEFKLYSKKIAFLYVLRGMMNSTGIKVNLENYFSNAILRRAISGDDDLLKDETVNEQLDTSRFLENITGDDFKMGRFREAINRRLTIDKALGHTLSRSIKLYDGKGFPRGTFINEERLAILKKFLVNEVYIQVEPKVVGRRFTGMVLTKLPKGTRMTSLVAEILDVTSESELLDYDNNSRLPEDIEVMHVIDDKTKVTEDILRLMIDLGYTSIECYSTESEVTSYPFEQEIIGNYTAQLRDFMDTYPEGCDGSEYTYYYGIEDPYKIKEITTPEKITIHDMLALVSYTARVETFPEFNEVDNRELDFLKKVNMYNEIFENAFKRVMYDFVETFKPFISRFINEGIEGNVIDKNPFSGFYRQWINAIDDKKLLRVSNDISLISIITQANRLSTFVKDDSAVPNEMRSLAMGFYSRICPYDTPAGRKIGLVNTIAVGCRIVDGVMKAPYRKVIRDEKGARLTDHIDYLTVQEEQKVIIGDRLAITLDENNYIQDAVINARVPSPVDGKEKVKFELVNSTQLDYVNAFSNQHLSPAAFLIVFASCNDGARVAFGINQYTQAVYTQDSDAPIVFTDMYSDIFKYSNDFLVKADGDGEVIAIDENSLEVEYEARTEYHEIITDSYNVQQGQSVKADQPISLSPIIRAKEDGVVESIEDNVITLRYDIPKRKETIKFKETQILNDCLMMMNFKVKEGDRFKKDDILMDTAASRNGLVSPGSNELIVYTTWGGYNYEDAIVPSVNATHKFISVSSKNVKRTVTENRDTYTPENFKNFKYVTEKGVITKIKKRNRTDSRLTSEENWTSGNASGILYKIDVNAGTGRSSGKSKEYVARLINYNRLEEADKMAGRHGNKGVTGLLCPDSEMLTFKNGVRARINLNPLGVISRMNGGQNLETHLGFCGYLSKVQIKSNPFNGASRTDIEILMELMYDIANNYDIRNTGEFNAVMDKYKPKGIPKEFLEKCVESYDHIKEWEGCFEKDGTAEMYDPAIGEFLPFRVAFGVSYMLKIHQEVRDKMHARGGMLSEPYNEITYQPTEGSSHAGGQKAGEMEVVGIASHGATNLAYETTNTLSDNLGARVEDALDALGIKGEEIPEQDKVPRAVNMFRYYAEALGIKVDSNFLPEVDQENIANMRKYSPREILELVERKHSETRVIGIDDESFEDMLGLDIDI